MRAFWLGVLVGMALFPLVGLVFVLMGWSPVRATADPPGWESVLGRTALASAVARQAPKLQNPIAATSENLRAGMKLFLDDCAGCHGDGVKRSRWGTTMFYPRVPQLGLNPTNKPDWQVFWIVQHGVRYTGMAGNGGLLPDNEIWKLATFLTNLNSLPPDVEQQWRAQQSGQ
jgi:mono/diheme cytochrome c family protein